MFETHRLALSLLDPVAAQALRVQPAATEDFFRFLVWHKLAPLWADHLANTTQGATDSALLTRLRQARLAETAIYLEQFAASAEIDAAFEAVDVRHAFIKGAAIRERFHAEPTLRPATDIDILVSVDQIHAAARALVALGFRAAPRQVNLTHEATFSRGCVQIDLHWNILSPRRLRDDIVQAFLDRRRKDALWGLCDSDCAFLMLVHPGFAKYVNSHHAALISVVDFALATQKGAIDWDATVRRLGEMGLQTCAWATLEWCGMVAPGGAILTPTGLSESIAPGRLRRSYLRTWLANDLSTRLLATSQAIVVGLTLPLHDRPSDVVRAVVGRPPPQADIASILDAAGRLA